MRVSALQACPELRKHAATPSRTASGRSASSRMTLGDLPPNSNATDLTVAAAGSATRRPARVEPVNETMSTSGWLAIASPTTGPAPITRLKTAGGRPTASMTSARMSALSGATSLGLSTTVQPAASAGATFAAIWCSGKFHGVMAPTTPTGSRSTSELPICSANLTSWSSAGIDANVAIGMPTWTRRASLRGIPTSRAMRSAMSSARAPSPPAMAWSSSARRSTGVPAHPANAPYAAATARSTSSGTPAGTLPMTASVLGLTTSIVAVPAEATHRPSMYSCSRIDPP